MSVTLGRRDLQAPGSWLSRSDPPLFISVTTVIVAYLGAGIQTVAAPEQYLVPGYAYIVDWARPEVWGWLAIAAGALMLLGLLLRTVWVLQFGIILSVVLTAAFTVGIGMAWRDGATVGIGFWIWFAITGSNIARLVQTIFRRPAA